MQPHSKFSKRIKLPQINILKSLSVMQNCISMLQNRISWKSQSKDLESSLTLRN